MDDIKNPILFLGGDICGLHFFSFGLIILTRFLCQFLSELFAIFKALIDIFDATARTHFPVGFPHKFSAPPGPTQIYLPF